MKFTIQNLRNNMEKNYERLKSSPGMFPLFCSGINCSDCEAHSINKNVNTMNNCRETTDKIFKEIPR